MCFVAEAGGGSLFDGREGRKRRETGWLFVLGREVVLKYFMRTGW